MSKTTVFTARLRDFDSVDGGGLNLDVLSGRIRDDNTITDKADQVVALTDDATNYVELSSVGVASANTSAFTSGSTPIALVVTASGSISSITDKRSWVVGGLAASGAPSDATYIVQTTDGDLSNEQAIGDLSSGILKGTTTTGVITSVAAPSGAVVGDTDTQTLTNKTVTSPIIRGIKTVALADGANIATDASLGNVFTVTLGGNRTLDNPTNATDGQKVIWRFKQDGTGTRTITLGSEFRFGTDITGVTLTTTADKTDYMGAIYNSTDSKWDVVAFLKGY